jgi:hypothetical protein
MEEKRQVKTFEVDYKCPKCGIGYLRPTGIAVGGFPMQYPHSCNNPECDYHEIMKGYQYPYLVYEPLNNGITMIMDGNVEKIQGKYVEPTANVGVINNYVHKPCGK